MTFDEFLAEVEPRLQAALAATYGPVVGRESAVDALSWAWEHWDRVQTLGNPAGYLYRVGQTAARTAQNRAVRSLADRPLPVDSRPHESAPELPAALARLSDQQRAVAVLVHGYAMSLREVAAMLEISVATVREHLSRAMARLREEMEEHDEC